MTENVQPSQVNDQKVNEKEYNFRALEARLQQERMARLEAEKRAAEAEKSSQERNKYPQKQEEDEEDNDDPYVDKKLLHKRLSSFERMMEDKIDKKAEEKAYRLLEKQKQEDWLRRNNDFHDVMRHADKFADLDPELAETILQMPEGFDRQKLVYRNIKALGLDKPKPAESSIQNKIDMNRRSPYYQPNNVGSAPYAGAGDFSSVGQKSAYDKMQELKSRLRI